MHRAGAAAVSLDVGHLDREVLDQLAESVDAGLGLWPGIVASTRPGTLRSDAEFARELDALFRRIDAAPAAMLERTVVTPTCGLARADVAWTREAYVLARGTARALAELVGADR
jgi:hypothetical protein